MRFSPIRRAVREDVDKLRALFIKSYESLTHVPKSEFPCFERELEASFDEGQVYRIRFFVIENETGQIVSFAGIVPTRFMGWSWELRWDTTHPDYQRQGLMTRLLQHRINYAVEENEGQPGILQVAARHPAMFIKHGFKSVFERNTDNYVMYLVKEI